MRTANCRILFIFACAGLLASCVPQLVPPIPREQAGLPADFPLAHYKQAESLGRTILHVEPRHSLVTVEVRRGGPFARFGHDHVVASHHVEGYVDIEGEGAQADLVVPLDRLTVDEPDLREQAKLDTQPSRDDIDGTRRNMLVKVLHAERYPHALIHIVPANRERSALRATITLHGTTRTVEVPVSYRVNKDSVVVSGRMTIRQTDFGMTPMSVLGGAIQVQDELRLGFDIRAVR